MEGNDVSVLIFPGVFMITPFSCNVFDGEIKLLFSNNDSSVFSCDNMIGVFQNDLV